MFQERASKWAKSISSDLCITRFFNFHQQLGQNEKMNMHAHTYNIYYVCVYNGLIYAYIIHDKHCLHSTETNKVPKLFTCVLVNHYKKTIHSIHIPLFYYLSLALPFNQLLPPFNLLCNLFLGFIKFLYQRLSVYISS